MPKVGRILEAALYVDDLERSTRFYQDVFGFEPLDSSARLCALSVAGQQVLLLIKKGGSLRPTVTPGGTIPPTDGDGNLHLAFTIAAEEFEAWEKWLQQHGVAIESKMHWEEGGQSLYFRDPDGHVIELATPGTWAIY